jgi:hypothetical protein
MRIGRKRIKQLEAKLAPKNPMAATIPEEERNLLAVVEEYTRLRDATDEDRPVREYRGNVPIPRVNVAKRALGPAYTRRQFLELVITAPFRPRLLGRRDSRGHAQNVAVVASDLSLDDDIGAVD